WVKVRDALGLENAKAAGWTGAFDGKDWSSKAFLAALAPRSGIFTLIDAKPVSDDILKLVPASATIAGACTVDFAKVLSDIRAGDTIIHYITLPIIRPAWTIKQGVLYVGLYPQVIVAATQQPSDGKSILDNENFAALRKRLAASHQATSLRYMDLEKTIPAVYPAWLFILGYT